MVRDITYAVLLDRAPALVASDARSAARAAVPARLRPSLDGACPRAPGEATGQPASETDDDACGHRDLLRKRRPDRERDHAEHDAEDGILGDGSYHADPAVQTARHARCASFFST